VCSSDLLITGGFDPIHSGHIAYLNEAGKLGDVLIVGANSDNWLRRKKGKEFMPWEERAAVLSSIKGVERVINFDDSDGSAKDAIRKVRELYPRDQIVFANGGDRTDTNIPEMDIQDNDLKFVFGVGGFHKANSSSWILQEWKAPKTERPWGYYRVLYENGSQVKLKELTVEPGKQLSMQRHSDRAEHWFVAEGVATVYTINKKTDAELLGVYNKFDHVHIKRTEWHQLANEGTEPLKMIEIQYGERCVEEDIERQ
jgi:D-beta-D-heptose 7-phosphate kinase/D-beta-D-heptose 1-phosphate adenosyltransferase